MTGPPRDWDKELAEIDKIIAKQPLPGSAAGGAGAPPVPAPRAAAAPAPVARAASAPAPVRGGALAAWIRVGLGVVVAVGVAQWPYRHACGIALYGYLAAAGGVSLVGLWGVVTGWRRRIGLAHTIALLVTLWGALIVGKAVLDRSGYVKQPATWVCP